MSDIEIPTGYTITLGGGVDMDLDNIHVKEIPKIQLETTVSVKELPKITTDSKVDAGLDNIHIKELPKIELDLGIKPTRIHMPMHTQICLSILGIKLLKLSVCGENMLITEPYVPRKAERCD